MNQIPGVSIGHAQNLEAATGCTVILAPQGVVCGVDQRGGAPLQLQYRKPVLHGSPLIQQQQPPPQPQAYQMFQH